VRVASKRAPQTFDDVVRLRQEVKAVDDRIVHQVAVGAIRLSGRNPREQLGGIDELASSLREHGLLQPIVVRRVAGGYELIAGHRRLEAWKTLGETQIAAVVRQETDAQAYVLMLVENLQREDLQPPEEAAALLELERELGSAVAVARAIKRSEAYVSKRKRVFEDPVLGPAVIHHSLPITTAEELLTVPDAGDRQELVRRAQRAGWDRPRVREAVRTFTAKDRPTTASDASSKVPAAISQRSRAVAEAAAQVQDLLDQGPVSELTAKARGELRRLYQRLALLVAD
jgi:ParB family chromosome partitioning protein